MTYYRVYVTADGIKCYDVFGFYHFAAWPTIERVQTIVRKRDLAHDPDVQVLEDALCLVFVETQFTDLTTQLGEEHMVDVVAKTLRKMTDAGREAALAMPLDDESLRIVTKALESVS